MFLGYNELWQGNPYTTSAICLQDSEMMVMTHQEFITLLQSNAEILETLAQDLEIQIAHLLQQTFHSARKRLVDILFSLYEKQEEIQSSGKILIASENIAVLMGGSTKTFTQLLSEFQEEGIIWIHEKQRHINILDYEKLKKVKTTFHLPEPPS